MSQNNKALLILATPGVIAVLVVMGLGSALVPLIIAFGLAYFSYPIIRKLESRGVKRNYAIAGVFAVAILAMVLALTLLIPRLVEDSRLFLLELPHTLTTAAERVENAAGQLGYSLEISQLQLREILTEHTSIASGEMIKSVSSFLKGLFSNFIKFLLVLLNIFLIPLFFFHLINKYERISSEINGLLPIPWRSRANGYVALANTVLSGYVRGLLLVALILAALYGVGFTVIGLKFGFLIGIATGLLSIIPYVGAVVGFAAAIAVALANFSGLGLLVGVVAVSVLVQSVESFYITPKLVGDKVGLGALSTMLALIIGGNIFGLIGMILSIPVAAMLKVLLIDLKQEYQTLSLYKG